MNNTKFKYLWLVAFLATFVVGIVMLSSCGNQTEIAVEETSNNTKVYNFDNAVISENETENGGYIEGKWFAVNVNNFEYFTDHENVIITGFSNDNNYTRIIVPSKINSRTVVKISESAFAKDTTNNVLKEIYICDSIKEIDTSSFENCNSIENIRLPNTLEKIGDSAFSGCGSLKSITVPNTVTNIGTNAFLGDNSLQSMSVPFVGASETENTYLGYFFGAEAYYSSASLVPSSLKEVSVTGTIIGDYAFYGCSSLTKFTIDNTVVSIGSCAFYRCVLESVIIPNSVKVIGRSAFSSCSSLKNVTIPESVTSIGASAFSECSSLTNIVIPEGVTSIGSFAFSGCSSLTNIVMPNGVTSINDRVFSDCSSLGSIIIPTSVTSIKEKAFENCISLTSIVIPEGVTNIDSTAFSSCYKLVQVRNLSNVTINGLPDNVDLEVVNGNSAFSGKLTYEKNYIIYTKGTNKYLMGFSGKEISNLNNLESLNLTGIYQYAFYDAIYSHHTSEFIIIIPNGVKFIGEKAFYDCQYIRDITIPISLTDIYGSAFDQGSVYKVYYEGTITSWLNINFYNEASNPINASQGFYLLDENGDVIYNDKKYSLLTRLVIPNEITRINAISFVNYDSLTEIIISSSVTSIGYCAFAFCDGITSIEIPESVIDIDEYAFYRCSNLTSIEFEVTTGWSRGLSRNIPSTFISMPSSDLSDTSTAAEYFTNTFANYVWIRS